MVGTANQCFGSPESALPLPEPQVHSLAPVDIMTPEWTTKMHFAPDAPIWVIGSGKTAIDVIKALARSTIPNVASRIRCVNHPLFVRDVRRVGRPSGGHSTVAIPRDGRPLSSGARGAGRVVSVPLSSC